MDIIEFFRHEQKRLHNWMRESVSDLAQLTGTGTSGALLSQRILSTCLASRSKTQ